MDHEAIEELLAGYTLRSLSGEDARDADRLLSEHVPSCPRCRDTLAVLQDVAGELALDAGELAVPEVLLPRLHRELDERRRRRPVTIFAAAASLVLVVGMAGIAVTQGIRANHVSARGRLFQDALDFGNQPGASTIPVGPVKEISRPGVEHFYIYGTNVPDPAPGSTYHVWLAQGSSFTHLGSFRPEGGVVILDVPFDPTTADHIVISEEPEDSLGDAPADVRWSSAA